MFRGLTLKYVSMQITDTKDRSDAADEVRLLFGHFFVSSV